MSFSSIKIKKPLLAPVHSVSYIRFKFRSQFRLLPQMRCPLTLRTESSTVGIDSNITDKIIRKVTYVLQEKCRSKIGALGDSTINSVFF